jgi:ATP-dependent exoDNAse (exonuclease V) alpha subunit
MLEARILTTVASGAIPDRPGIDPAAVESRLGSADAPGRELTDGQREAVKQLCRGSRYGFLVAPAGAGKTTAMSAVVNVHTRAWFEVIGLAPSARAAALVLADETGAPAKTLARYLRDGCRGLGDRTLVLVDEAGMVGSFDWGRLIDAVEARGARL